MAKKSVRERRINLRHVSAGHVIEFPTWRELVTGKSIASLDTLCRAGDDIVQGTRYCDANISVSNKHKLTRIRTYGSSEDLAEQRIYDALNQLLNEYGIK